MKHQVIREALKIMEDGFIEGKGSYNQSELVKDYCRLQLGNESEEVFGVMFLNKKLGLLAFDKLFRGSISEATIPPRAIARRMFELNAGIMIFTHNHPSGNVSPSKSDVDTTKKLKALFKQLDCEVVDHIIVSPIDAFSMCEHMKEIFE